MSKRIVPNELDEKKKGSMIGRLIVSAVLIGTALPCIILGSWFWFAFVTVFLLIATHELIHVTKKKYSPFVYVVVYAAVLAFVYWFLIKGNVQEYRDLKMTGNEGQWKFSLENYYHSLSISVYAIGTLFGALCFLAIIDKSFDWTDVMYLFTMSIIVGLGFQAFLFIRYFPFAAYASGDPNFDPDWTFKLWGSLVFPIFVVLGTYLNDAGAYFVGVFFGKHKMNPRISPNKTWEGFWGGKFIGGALTLTFALICDACGFPLLPTMVVFGTNSAWWWVVLLSFGMPFIADLGDFTFSLIKRFYQIKDYGFILGPMGGVLDRADSLSFVCIFAAVIAVFVSQGWNIFI